jgi:hypothetical protein
MTHERAGTMVDKSQIVYDEGLREKLEDVPDDQIGQDGKTLLRLMHWALYTQEGRNFLFARKPDAKGQLDEKARTELIDKFKEAGVGSEDVQNAIVEAHVAAHQWVAARKTDSADKRQAEKVYLQKMSFVTWCLFEDLKNHEFSLLW